MRLFYAMSAVSRESGRLVLSTSCIHLNYQVNYKAWALFTEMKKNLFSGAGRKRDCARQYTDTRSTEWEMKCLEIVISPGYTMYL
jgi:hypothetical protein